jgi:hypothetical protein
MEICHVTVPQWELELGFQPESIVSRQQSTWSTLEGGIPTPNSSHVSAEEALAGAQFDLLKLPVRDPSMFVSGQLHQCVDAWEYIFEQQVISEGIQAQVREWLHKGVDVSQFFTHFKGNFRGKPYDSDIPPSSFFPNSHLCKKFQKFVCETLTFYPF